ncbi:MAG: hypothetical protein M3480_02985 [Verrucomicrobiota bacterium]|nr:hypothetical protein [Chthoniobacterales bacterium]MDQ3413932.1 hypothetical protein [Verrucomicrobiota bacterium]
MKPPFLRHLPLIRLAFGLALPLVWAGCNRSDDQITVYRIPKETPTPAIIPPTAQAGAAGPAVHWTAPAGWEEQAASGFRKGSFIVTGPDGKKADVSVISFPEAAGGLLANVNRWRDQLKLPPITDVVQAGTPMEVAGRDMFFVELVSEQPLSPDGSKSRILGGIFPAGSETWFFKMIGPDALVASQREGFKQFLQSVHPAEGEVASSTAPGPMSANAGGNDSNAPTPPPIQSAQGAPVQYTLPSGWKEKPLTPMRLASFQATAPNGKETDISVVALPGVAGGDLANVNRWRGQMQLPPIDEDALAKTAEHVTVNGHDFLLVDLASEQPINGEKQRILAAILDENERSWFIKMTGEDAAVASQKSAFTDFLRGLKIP